MLSKLELISANAPHMGESSLVSVNSNGGALIIDNFVDTNGTNLTSHTISPVNLVAASWAKVNDSGNATIQSNTCQDNVFGNLAPDSVYSVNVGVYNHTITTVVQSPAENTDCAVAVRIAGSGHTAQLYFVQPQFTSANIFAIYEYTTGYYALRASTSIPQDENPHTLVVKTSGSTITATMDSNYQLTYSNATVNPTSTLVGIRGGKNTTAVCQWNSFKVTSP